MTDESLLNLLCTATGKDALKHLSAMPEDDRRGHGKAVFALYRKAFLTWMPDEKDPIPVIRDSDAIVAGLFATARLSDMKGLRFVPHLKALTVTEIVEALGPAWIQDFVEHMVDENPHAISALAPLWKAGLCARPKGDALILGYYEHAVWRRSGVDEADLLAGDVWRFFEVGGGGEFSLSNHDKYIKQGTQSWSDRLIRYADEGRLDRQRLLDASLDALERDFGQYIAGWYSRFHAALEPDPEERAARAERYLRLLASSVPPTVSFAMKQVRSLEKAGALDPQDLIEALDPALQARAKGTVTAALKLLARAAGRDDGLKADARRAAMLALVSEDAGVQGAALDLIEALGGAQDAELCAELGGYAELVAPSVRGRVAALAGTSGASPPEDPTPEGPVAAPVVPVGSAAETLALYLRLLEEARDPFEVERAIDGLARFGPELAADETALSPLRKRAGQILKRPVEEEMRAVLALTALSLADGRPVAEVERAARPERRHHLLDTNGAQAAHLRRNGEILDQIGAGHALPLLSLPSDTSGMIDAADLAERLAVYRAAGVPAGHADLALALMRLRPGDDCGDLPPETEADHALAYALGRDVEVGPDPALWSAAWRARSGDAPDPRITALVGQTVPGCGSPAQITLEVTRTDSEGGEYFWIAVAAPVRPKLDKRRPLLPALFFHEPAKAYFTEAGSGHQFADIAWASLVRPADPEPFFREAILKQDTWQKLTDNPTRAYLEPFFRPGPEIGPFGAATLVFYMGCEDPSVTALAADAAVVAFVSERLDPEQFGAALKTFILSHSLPLKRWIKGLQAMAGAGVARPVLEAMTRVLDFAPEETPRDIGGFLELYFELCTATGERPNDPVMLRCLGEIPGGGKVATFRKKLLKLAE